MSGNLASDLNNPNFAGATNPDSLLVARFYKRAIKDNYKSLQEGRPIFMDVNYVEIMTPGGNLNIVDVPVRAEHKIRFPREWAIFQNSQSDEQIIGTRVDEWPLVTRAQAEELKGAKFFTVEQIAGASDEQMQRLGMAAQMLKQKAVAFLAKANDTAQTQKQVEELAKRDQQINDLTATVQRLAHQIEQMQGNPVQTEPKPKRKYTKRQPQTQGPDA